ncbi:MAG: tRNA (guanosine(37)-N1)-methyltransferase TrmD [Eubacteriales bacterium]
MYQIDIMTLFPDVVGDMLCESILGRAQERGHIRINCHQIRDYTKNKQKQVDNYPYGGGKGAVMQADPLYNCWKHICDQAGVEKLHTIYFTPTGRTFVQSDAIRLKEEHTQIIMVCGHYEGIDQRFIDGYVDEEISIGDFVLTGGELPAMVVADAVCRLVPHVLSSPECYENESHWDGLLEGPQYSRPETWQDRSVPPILLSGNHQKVERWRRKQSILRTKERRPDLYEKLDLSSKEDAKMVAELEQGDTD